MKKILAILMTAAIVVLAFFMSSRRQSSAPEEPERAVWRMLDQSREGNVERYLDCFSGNIRSQLQATAEGMGPTKFAAYLRSAASKVKGVAVSDVRRLSGEKASLILEYVYSDYNERQRFELKIEAGSWRIISTEGSQRIQPLIPYGKPVEEVP